MKLLDKPEPGPDGSFGPQCLIRYEDTLGTPIHEGECDWMETFRLDDLLARWTA